MEKKKVLIEINVEDELPNKNTSVICYNELSISDSTIEQDSEYKTFGAYGYGGWFKPTHWLKEQELYVLSDKQMEEVSNYFVNKLIDILPTGDVSAFDLIKAINTWVGNQSLYIASLNLK